MMHSKKTLQGFALLTVSTVLMIAGCGGPEPARDVMVDVKGKLTYKNAPVKHISMRFIPTEAGKGREDVCLVENGEYSNRIMAGSYKICFDAIPGSTPLPKKYYSDKTTTIVMDANSKMDKDIEINP